MQFRRTDRATLGRVKDCDIGIAAGTGALVTFGTVSAENSVLNGSVKSNAVVDFHGGRKVATGAVVERPAPHPQDGLAFARCVRERNTRAEVIVVGHEGLPVVAKAEGELCAGVEFDLVLEEGAELVDPIDAATGALICASTERAVRTISPTPSPRRVRHAPPRSPYVSTIPTAPCPRAPRQGRSRRQPAASRDAPRQPAAQAGKEVRARSGSGFHLQEQDLAVADVLEGEPDPREVGAGGAGRFAVPEAGRPGG